MSEELYGREATEAAQRYVPLADPQASAEPKTFGNDAEGLRAAANELTDRRTREQQGQPVIARQYQYLDGERAGEPIGWDPETARHEGTPLHTVTAERAARDLADVRQNDVIEDSVAKDLDLANTIDAHRAEAAAELRPEPPPRSQMHSEPQPELTPQSEAQPAETSAGVDPEIAQALQNPKVRAALADAINHAANHVGAVEQQYMEALGQNAAIASASLLAAFPELQGINDIKQLHTAISVVAKSNPQRAQQMVAHIQAVDHIAREHQQAQLQQAHAVTQQAQKQMTEWDDQFYEKITNKGENSEQFKRVQGALKEMITEAGYDLAAVQHVYNNTPALHHPLFQEAMYLAGLMRLAQKTAAQPARRPIAPVMRPGSAEHRSADSYGLETATKSFFDNPNPRSAAAALVARRAAREARR